MEKNYEYDSDLDILHVYSKEIREGIKVCLSIGDFNIDINIDNKVVGIEIEEKSKNFGLSPNILSSPDEVKLIVRKSGNSLFMGVGIIKGNIKSSTHITTSVLPQKLLTPMTN